MSPLRDRSTLARVLEPEAMDSADEARDYDAMDHAEVNRCFAADFLAALAAAGLPDDSEVLDLGTGTAQIPIELCRQSARIRVVAIDLAAAMLELAERNVEQAGLAERIRLQLVDAKRLPFDDGHFTAVMSNSIVHHVPQPAVVLDETLRVLRGARGLAFVRDLARPYDDEELASLVDAYAGDGNAHQRKLFADSLRAALSVAEIRQLVVSRGFDPATVTATSDRHWTFSAVTGS